MRMGFYTFHALPTVVVPTIPLLCISTCPDPLLLALALLLFYIAIKFGVNRIMVDCRAGVQRRKLTCPGISCFCGPYRYSCSGELGLCACASSGSALNLYSGGTLFGSRLIYSRYFVVFLSPSKHTSGKCLDQATTSSLKAFTIHYSPPMIFPFDSVVK